MSRKRVGLIEIMPGRSLSETAAIVGDVLGLEFSEDDHYEEYPAYSAHALGLAYALLGQPDPEFDIRAVKSNTFQLRLEEIGSIRTSEEGDLSERIATMIRADGRLECAAI